MNLRSFSLYRSLPVSSPLPFLSHLPFFFRSLRRMRTHARAHAHTHNTCVYTAALDVTMTTRANRRSRNRKFPAIFRRTRRGGGTTIVAQQGASLALADGHVERDVEAFPSINSYILSAVVAIAIPALSLSFSRVSRPSQIAPSVPPNVLSPLPLGVLRPRVRCHCTAERTVAATGKAINTPRTSRGVNKLDLNGIFIARRVCTRYRITLRLCRSRLRRGRSSVRGWRIENGNERSRSRSESACVLLSPRARTWCYAVT